jgi:hypothetical protein
LLWLAALVSAYSCPIFDNAVLVSSSSWMEVSPNSIIAGETVTVRAHLLDDDGKPLGPSVIPGFVSLGVVTTSYSGDRAWTMAEDLAWSATTETWYVSLEMTLSGSVDFLLCTAWGPASPLALTAHTVVHAPPTTMKVDLPDASIPIATVTPVSVSVTDDYGNPVPGLFTTVAIGSDIFPAAYSGNAGVYTVLVTVPLTPGWLEVTTLVADGRTGDVIFNDVTPIQTHLLPAFSAVVTGATSGYIRRRSSPIFYISLLDHRGFPAGDEESTVVLATGAFTEEANYRDGSFDVTLSNFTTPRGVESVLLTVTVDGTNVIAPTPSRVSVYRSLAAECALFTSGLLSGVLVAFCCASLCRMFRHRSAPSPFSLAASASALEDRLSLRRNPRPRGPLLVPTDTTGQFAAYVAQLSILLGGPPPPHLASPERFDKLLSHENRTRMRSIS